MRKSSARENIVLTASNLFYKNGYNLTGINEIIAEAGIAKATLYNNFRSKEDICIAYLQHKDDVFTQNIRSFCLAQPKGKQQVLALFDFLIEFFQGDDFNGCWCIKTVAELPKDDERIKAEIQKQKNKLIRFIQELIETNLPRRKEPELLAKQIYLLYESGVSESHLHQDSWPIEASKKTCEALLK